MRDQRPLPPRGLAAFRIEDGDDELILFTWGGAGPPTRTPALSTAEKEVLAGIVSGASNRAIAQSRRVSERTIANQVASILRKVGARSRFELIRRFSDA